MSETASSYYADRALMTWNTTGSGEGTSGEFWYTWDSVPDTFTWDDNYITSWVLEVESKEFNITDSFSKVVTFRRYFEESFNLNDSFAKQVTKNLSETIYLDVQFIQNSASIVYDISVRSASYYDLQDLRTFARQSQIAGYEQGVEFLPGDYDFERAVIGLVVTNNNKDSTIGFKEIDMYTDTPDVMDRGAAEITNSGPNYDSQTGYTKVYYNKPYHLRPNVVAAVVGGSVLSDYIIDPNDFTNTYFRVKLVAKSDYSTPTTGNLLWKATGY